MAKKKPGHVVRLSDFAFSVIEENREGSVRETIDQMIVRFAELSALVEAAPSFYVLESSLHRTKKEAKGEAVVRAVRSRSKEIEEPKKVRVIE